MLRGSEEYKSEKRRYDAERYATLSEEERIAIRRRLANNHLRRKYNVSLEDYGWLLSLQEGGCAICGRTPEEEGRRLAIDHDHETSKIRGLLCHNCNRGLGYFQNDPFLLTLAIGYLEG